MGKVRCNNKAKLIALTILSILLLILISASHAASSSREFELFDQGYKYYLSYQPEKAVEEFRIFLKEFPKSSAKDAVMFWLGKSLLQLKSVEEARQIFSDMKQQFPGSPFISYVDKELEVINRTYDFAKTMTGNVNETKITDNAALQTSEPDTEAKIQEKDIRKGPEEKESPKPLPEKEREETPKTIETAATPSVTAGGEKTLPAGPALGKRVVYSIQIGVFKKQKTADNLRLEFEKEGYPAKVKKGTSKGADVFKVLVGKFDSRNDAELIARKLKRKYGANAIVSMPEVSEEMQIARADSIKAVEDRDRLRPLSESVEKKEEELSTMVTQPERRDAGGKDVEELKIEDRKTSGEVEGSKLLSEQERGETLKNNETVVEPGGAAASEKQLAAVPALEKKTEEPAARVTEAESKDAELKDLQAKPQELPKNHEEAEKHIEAPKDEKEQLNVSIQPLKDEKAQTDSEKEKLKSEVSAPDASYVRIEDKRYTVQEISEYMAGSVLLLDKLHIREVLWRTGNDDEDFLTEQVLYNEAKSLNVTTDMNSLREMTEKYQLHDREADYLQRYLIISDLIDKKIRDMPEEKVVESLIVKYGEGDKYMKIVLDTELQNLARNGTPFEEIYRLYPDLVRFTITGFQETEERVKEKIQPLQDNDIVVTWSDDGYMILKPISKGPSVKPFGDISPALRDRIRTYIIPWIKGLKEKYAIVGVGQPK